MIINVHGGHSLKCRGASGYLDEVNEDRAVKNRVIELLRANGHTVYDCTDDVGKTQNANLRNIVRKCNAHKVDLDVSIHLNAGGGTGTEVYIYNNNSKAKDEAARIANNISNALGIRNRGVKPRTNLYVLRKTNSPSLLVECCFVDNATDKAHWNVNKCAEAIVKGILGGSCNTQVAHPSNPQPSVPQSHATSNKKECIKTGQQRSIDYCGHSIKIDGLYGNNTQKNINRCFQKAMNSDYKKSLSIDGIAGNNTCKALGKHYVKKGERQELVRAVQIALYCHGYNPEWTDGIFGTKTEESVKAFQREHGLSADGIAGRNTILKLMGK